MLGVARKSVSWNQYWATKFDPFARFLGAGKPKTNLKKKKEHLTNPNSQKPLNPTHRASLFAQPIPGTMVNSSSSSLNSHPLNQTIPNFNVIFLRLTFRRQRRHTARARSARSTLSTKSLNTRRVRTASPLRENAVMTVNSLVTVDRQNPFSTKRYSSKHCFSFSSLSILCLLIN